MATYNDNSNEYASKGVGTAGLTTGIIGTVGTAIATGIHVGNDAVKDSSGCVLVGMGRKGDKLVESQPAETMVTMLCRNVKKLVITEN